MIAYSNTTMKPGVGISGLTANNCPGLGILPLFEGQFRKYGMMPYTLVLVPKAGTILLGEFECAWESPGHFAAPANHLIGDEISFSFRTP
jgi:hypothetical protein